MIKGFPECLRYQGEGFINYKIKIPEGKWKTEALFNMEDKVNSIGGDVWICLWFREGTLGNQVSFEYNRFSGDKMVTATPQRNSVGLSFAESYLSIDLIPFLKKSLNVFQKIIGKKENDYVTSLYEFKEMVIKEFGEKDGEKQTKII